MLKRLLCCTIALTLLVVCCFVDLEDFSDDVATAGELQQDFVIIIDAGHGGFDGGAVAFDGTLEKTLNLSIALKLDVCLSVLGYNTVLVRNDDSATNNPNDIGISAKVSDIKNRVAMMKKYPNGIFVSVHMNKYTTTQPHGAQVFYSGVDNSQNLALLLQNSIARRVQPDNKRIIKQAGKDIYLLKHATIPSVIVECGFLSNPDELKLLKSDSYQTQIAVALAFGIVEYVNTNEI